MNFDSNVEDIYLEVKDLKIKLKIENKIKSFSFFNYEILIDVLYKGKNVDVSAVPTYKLKEIELKYKDFIEKKSYYYIKNNYLKITWRSWTKKWLTEFPKDLGISIKKWLKDFHKNFKNIFKIDKENQLRNIDFNDFGKIEISLRTIDNNLSKNICTTSMTSANIVTILDKDNIEKNMNIIKVHNCNIKLINQIYRKLLDDINFILKWQKRIYSNYRYIIPIVGLIVSNTIDGQPFNILAIINSKDFLQIIVQIILPIVYFLITRFLPKYIIKFLTKNILRVFF